MVKQPMGAPLKSVAPLATTAQSLWHAEIVVSTWIAASVESAAQKVRKTFRCLGKTRSAMSWNTLKWMTAKMWSPTAPVHWLAPCVSTAKTVWYLPVNGNAARHGLVLKGTFCSAMRRCIILPWIMASWNLAAAPMALKDWGFLCFKYWATVTLCNYCFGLFASVFFPVNFLHHFITSTLHWKWEIASAIASPRSSLAIIPEDNTSCSARSREMDMCWQQGDTMEIYGTLRILRILVLFDWFHASLRSVDLIRQPFRWPLVSVGCQDGEVITKHNSSCTATCDSAGSLWVDDGAVEVRKSKQDKKQDIKQDRQHAWWSRLLLIFFWYMTFQMVTRSPMERSLRVESWK